MTQSSHRVITPGIDLATRRMSIHRTPQAFEHIISQTPCPTTTVVSTHQVDTSTWRFRQSRPEGPDPPITWRQQAVNRHRRIDVDLATWQWAAYRADRSIELTPQALCDHHIQKSTPRLGTRTLDLSICHPLARIRIVMWHAAPHPIRPKDQTNSRRKLERWCCYQL